MNHFFIKKTESPESFFDLLTLEQIRDGVKNGTIQSNWLATQVPAEISYATFTQQYPQAQWISIDLLLTQGEVPDNILEPQQSSRDELHSAAKTTAMPARLIVVYVLIALRVLVNTVVVIRSVPMESAEQKLQFTVGTFELSFSLFIIIALAQRKYLAINVFRPYVVASCCLTWALQIYAGIINSQKGVEYPFAPAIGGAFMFVFLLWFQWYVADPKVKAYLSAQKTNQYAQVLPAEIKQEPDHAVPRKEP